MTAAVEARIDSRASAALRIVAVLALVSILVARCWSFDYIVDDAYIAFRYARNLALFGELVFNEGQRVEGVTNLLWTLILAVAEAQSLSVERFAQVLGVLCAGALLIGVVVTGLRRGLSFGEAWFVGLFLAILAPLPLWAQSGMETAAFALAFFLSVVKASRAERTADGIGVGLLCGVAFALRPEGALALLLVCGSAWLQRQRVSGWIVAAAASFLIPAAAVTAFRFIHYGALLPNTMWAKQNGATLLLSDGCSYAAHFVTHYLSGMMALLLGVCAWKGQLRTVAVRASRHPFLQCCMGVMVYVTLVGGDWMPFHRFFVPVLPLLLIGLVEASRDAYASLARGLMVVLAGLTLVATLGLERLGFDGERLTYNRDHLRPVLELVAEGLNRLEQRPSIAIGAAGLVSYRTSLKTTDLFGLTDATIASNAPSSTPTLPGHHKFIQEQRLESIHPDLVFVNVGISVSPAPLKHLPPWGLEAELFGYPAFARNYRLVAFPTRGGVVNAYRRQGSFDCCRVAVR